MATRSRKDLGMSGESRGKPREFQGYEAPSFTVGFEARKPGSVQTFGDASKLKQSVGETIRFFVMQFRKACRADPKGKANTRESSLKRQAANERRKSFEGNSEKPESKLFKATVRSSWRKARLVTRFERIL